MYKGRSKSKMKQSTAFIKKQCQDKQKKYSKDIMKRSQIKQNLDTITKFNMTSIQSKKKNKPSGGVDTSRSISPLGTNVKKNDSTKNDDEKFIQKLFSQNIDELARVFFIEDLIEGLVPNQKKDYKEQSHNHKQSKDILKQLHLKNQQVASLQQQLQQLKLYISNFTFKVFDLTVLCRKYSKKILNQQQNLQFNRSTDEVIAYLDNLVKHWKLENKIKLHCQKISKRISIQQKNNKIDDIKKRCHTQSLKIPIQEYLQSLQNTAHRKLFPKQIQKKQSQQQQSQQIMKILSRRSSGRKKQQEQIYVVLRQYKAKNENQLDLKPGQSISVLQKNANQRWLGYKEGKIGYFQKQCLF